MATKIALMSTNNQVALWKTNWQLAYLLSFWGMTRGQSMISFLSLKHTKRKHELFHTFKRPLQPLSLWKGHKMCHVPHQRSLHISWFQSTRCRGVCLLHLHYQRVMSSYYLLVSGAVVFTQACSPYMLSSDSVYTKPARSDEECSCTFFSLFGQWESCQCFLGQHTTSNGTGERAAQLSTQIYCPRFMEEEMNSCASARHIK